MSVEALNSGDGEYDDYLCSNPELVTVSCIIEILTGSIKWSKIGYFYSICITEKVDGFGISNIVLSNNCFDYFIYIIIK